MHTSDAQSRLQSPATRTNVSGYCERVFSNRKLEFPRFSDNQGKPRPVRDSGGTPLGAKITQSRDRQTELADLLNQVDSEPPSQDDLKALGAELREAITTGTAHDRKRLLQALVHEVRVQARDHIVPVFKDPASFAVAQVRTLEELVPAAGFEPAAFCSGGRRSIP